MSVHLDRAQLLLQTHRPVDAEREARDGLGAEPQDPQLLRLLSLALLEQEKFAEARTAATDLIGQAPDWSEAHLTAAEVELRDQNYSAAMTAAEAALRLSPGDSRPHAVLGWACAGMQKWELAVQEAEAGLALDPENHACSNLRALALSHLGRKAEGLFTAESSLSRNPEDSHTQFTAGWVKLQQGLHREALDHFVEALRLDPTNEAAREGLVEALKARNPIYRGLLAYSFWMMRLKPGQRMMVVWGGLIGYNILRNLPALSAWSTLLTIVWITFVMLSWVGSAFFDFLLLFDRKARHALNPRQCCAAVAVVACMAGAGIWMVAGLADRAFDPLLAYCILLFAIPLTRAFNKRRGKRKIIGYAVIGGISALLVVSIFSSVFFDNFMYPFFLILSLAAYTWFGSLLDK